MKLKRLFDSLKSSKFRHGGYATLLILAAIAIVIVINLLVDLIPLKADLTQEKLFSLSEETVKLLADLKTDVRITSLEKVGQQDTVVGEVLAKYARASRHISLASVDPDRNPGWSKQYDPSGNGLREGAVVVATADGKKYKTIERYDMYNVDYSNQNQQPQVTGLSVEQRLTSAIQYVTADKNPTIYVLQGHGEDTLPYYGLSTPVENENYVSKDLNLLSSGSVPADADIIVALSPKTDFSAQDAEKMRAYLSSGGRAMFLLNLPTQTAAFPNLDGLLKSYGIAIKRLVVVEGDPNRLVSGNPLFLLPKLEYHDILSRLNSDNIPVILPVSEAIDTLALKKSTLKIEPLMSSSENSWGKVNYANVETLSKERGDIEGPFTLAVAITDQSKDPKVRDAKLVVVGSANFLRQDFTSQVPGNTDFFLNSLSWLREKKDTISIQPKNLLTFRLRINELQSMALSGVVVILMPLIVLGSGFVVWMRRRHL